MAYLGTPYRVTYEAKYLRSGLTDVKAFVVKPDSTVAGLFSLAEMPFTTLRGLYTYDLMTSENDPEGEWIGIILSPSENVKTAFRISLQKNPLVQFQNLFQALTNPGGGAAELQGSFELSSEYVGQVERGPELLGFIETGDIEAEIEQNLETVGSPDETDEIIGAIDHEL